MKTAFPQINPIAYEGAQSKNPLAFKHYNPDEIVEGKTMREHLRFAVVYWHTFRGTGSDPFGAGTMQRPWDDGSNTVINAQNRARVAFEFISKLGAPYYCWHDRDVAPEGKTLSESNKNFDAVAKVLKEEQRRTGVKLLWGTANLFSNPRFVHGASTSCNADVFAFAAAQVKKALEVTKELDVYGMAPPSSGGLTTGEALNILQGWDLSSEPRTQALFQYLESSRLAFADRNAYIGDSDYEPVPQHGLLDPAFAATRRCLVGNTALTSPAAPGTPHPPYANCATSNVSPNPVHEGTQTNHLVVADKWGNVVSYTNTIEQIAGSGMTVPGRGFLLNNEMTDFDFAAAAPGTYDPNLPAAGKRPRSSMNPTIVLKDGVPDFTIGSPGGSTIITTVLQILLNHVDFGMTLPQAIAAPRASQRNAATTDAEAGFYNSALAQQLTAQFGESFKLQTGTVLPLNSWIGNATGIQLLPGGRFQAVAEPVRLGGGSALVVNGR